MRGVFGGNIAIQAVAFKRTANTIRTVRLANAEIFMVTDRFPFLQGQKGNLGYAFTPVLVAM
jgi:hypothetical protein